MKVYALLNKNTGKIVNTLTSSKRLSQLQYAFPAHDVKPLDQVTLHVRQLYEHWGSRP